MTSKKAFILGLLFAIAGMAASMFTWLTIWIYDAFIKRDPVIACISLLLGIFMLAFAIVAYVFGGTCLEYWTFNALPSEEKRE